MGFLEKRRRQAHANSTDWSLAASVMLMGYELLKAEAKGYEGDEQMQRAMEVRDRVIDVIGFDHFVQCLIDMDYEMQTPDKDAVLYGAMGKSDYRRVRRSYFSDL